MRDRMTQAVEAIKSALVEHYRDDNHLVAHSGEIARVSVDALAGDALPYLLDRICYPVIDTQPRCRGCGHHAEHHPGLPGAYPRSCKWRGCGCPALLEPFPEAQAQASQPCPSRLSPVFTIPAGAWSSDRCVQAAGHEGAHRNGPANDLSTITWTDPDPEKNAPSAEDEPGPQCTAYKAPDGRCTRASGHLPPHRNGPEASLFTTSWYESGV